MRSLLIIDHQKRNKVNMGMSEQIINQMQEFKNLF